MFNLKSKLRVGLDIGSHSIKVVAIERGTHRTHRLVQARSREIFSGAEPYDPEGPKKATLVPLLLEIFYEMGLPPRRLRHLGSAVGGLNISAKEIRALHLADEEMVSAMLLEARKHLPLDGTETIVDYQILGDDPKEPDKVRVLLAATTKRTFEAHMDTLREIELQPGVVDIEPLATLNSYLSATELPDEGVLVFLNVGCRKTNLSVLGRKDVFLTRDLPIGGYHFTLDLMRDLSMEYREAENLKTSRGLRPDVKRVGEPTASLSVTEKSALEKLGDEVSRSLRYYVKETGQGLFVKFVLTGGTAGSKDLQTFLYEKFNLPAEAYNPLAQFEGGAHFEENPWQFAAAAGLALRAQAV
ncbi:MAG: pilus assembly protein PilM [bacterium]